MDQKAVFQYHSLKLKFFYEFSVSGLDPRYLQPSPDLRQNPRPSLGARNRGGGAISKNTGGLRRANYTASTSGTVMPGTGNQISQSPPQSVYFAQT